MVHKHIGFDVELINGFLATLIVKCRNVEELVAVNLVLPGRAIKTVGFSNCSIETLHIIKYWALICIYRVSIKSFPDYKHLLQ